MFSLIGPKRYDAPWKDIEAQGWIAPAECTEVRVTLTDAERMTYAVTEAEERYRVAATARTKLPVVRALVEQHPDEQVLVIGALHRPAAPAGRIPRRPDHAGLDDEQGARAALRRVPRRASCGRWCISKVGNFSIDLPEAAVAIQVSGTFGSRQEEAQRLGRVLRPKADGRQAHFYTVVSRDTIDTEYAAHRQRFLAERARCRSSRRCDKHPASRSWSSAPTSTNCTAGRVPGRPDHQGATTNKERERLFDAFRSGELKTLVLSKVGNFSIDLPEAAVAIQVSGTFGSRQEEAQRLGRVLRPRATGVRRTSTRSSRATRSTPSMPRTGSASWPSRGTPTRSWTRTTCSARRCPRSTRASASGRSAPAPE